MDLSTPTPVRTNPGDVVPAQRQPCAPWCASHDHGEDACYAADKPIPGRPFYDVDPYVGISRQPGENPLIGLYRSFDDLLTPDEAEQIGRALIAAAQAARAAS
jgi:hypothetical protein